MSDEQQPVNQEPNNPPVEQGEVSAPKTQGAPAGFDNIDAGDESASDESVSDWRQSFGDLDDKSKNYLERYGTPRDLINAGVNASAKIQNLTEKLREAQKGRLNPPQEGAPPEEWTAYNESLGFEGLEGGVTPEAYIKDFEPFDTFVPERDQDFLNTYSEVAHKNGLTKSQSDELMAYYADMQQRQVQEFNAAAQERDKDNVFQLTKELGSRERYQEDTAMIADFGNSELGADFEKLRTLRDENGSLVLNDPNMRRLIRQAAMISRPDMVMGPNNSYTKIQDVQEEFNALMKKAGQQGMNNLSDQEKKQAKDLAERLSRRG